MVETYLDIIQKVKENFKIPVLAYQVSGEYSLIKIGINNKLINKDAIIESLMCFKNWIHRIIDCSP